MVQKLKRVIRTHELSILEMYFDTTIIINKQNEVQIIDNQLEDYKDFINSNTLVVKHVKISI